MGKHYIIIYLKAYLLRSEYSSKHSKNPNSTDTNYNSNMNKYIIKINTYPTWELGCSPELEAEDLWRSSNIRACRRGQKPLQIIHPFIDIFIEF